jgi:hypothetical protein
VEQSTENMKTGVIIGAEYRKHEFWYSVPLMTPVFMFSVLYSTDDTSFYVFGTLLHRWHQFSVFGTLLHWWHQFLCFRCSSPPMAPVSSLEQSIENMKTWKLVSSVEQIAENMKIGAIGGAEYRKMKTWWHQFSCFRYSVPLMTPVFMFSVLCSTDDTSFPVFGTLLHWWH